MEAFAGIRRFCPMAFLLPGRGVVFIERNNSIKNKAPKEQHIFLLPATDY
jgi:hypothetical protein